MAGASCMTLVTAWIRSTRGLRELVIASDSRLSGGESWNCGPKLFPLQRGDAVLAFAGATTRSYPLIVQASRWADDYEKARVRAMDLHDFKGHAERMMTSMITDVDTSGLHPRPTAPRMDCTIVLAGYSTTKQTFCMWNSRYDARTGKISFVRTGGNVLGSRGKHVVFVGEPTSAAVAAKRRLKRRLQAAGTFTVGSLDWEPLEVLRDLCRDSSFGSIGGPIQMVKVYDYLTTMPYAVRWRESPKDTQDGWPTLFGRRLLEYERTQRMEIDIDTMKTRSTWHYAQDCNKRKAIAGENPDVE
jgi:hypothetical protein